MTDTNRSDAVPRRKSGDAIALLFWLVVLPVALIALGLWQLDRSERAQVAVEAAGLEMNRTLADVRQLADDTPNAIIRFEGGQNYIASIAVAQLENAVADNGFLVRVSAFRAPVAYVTIAGGVLAILGGLLGVVLSSVAGFRARSSREALVTSFGGLRLVLPFLLAALVLGLAIAVLGAALFETASLPFWGDVSTNALKLGLGGIVLAGFALYCAVTAVRGLRKVFRLAGPEPIEAMARAASPAEAPGLWAFTQDLASRMGAELPDTIVVGLTEGFYVTENPVRLLPEDRVLEGRTLYVPAPLLELLDREEIAAIVGHELAHFVGEDTLYSTRFVPIYSSFQRSLGALYGADINGDFGIAAGLRLGHHALSRFDTAVAHWSRLREFEADRLSGLVGTPRGIASALVRSRIADAPAAFVLETAFHGQHDFGPDLVAATARVAAEQGLPEPIEHLEDRQPHPTDSHPPTIQRIGALELVADGPLLGHATRAHDPAAPSFGRTAFADWDGFCRSLSADFLAHADLLRSEYREQLQTAASSVAEEEVVLYENAGVMAATMIVLAVLIGVFIASVYLFPFTMGFGNDETTKAVVAGILGTGLLIVLAFFAMFRRRGARPLMVLRPETLTSHWLGEPVRWDDVAAYRVHAAQRLALQLFLEEGAPLPSKARFSFYNKVKPKRRLVELDAFGIRGMKADEFSELVGRYVGAAHARRALGSE